MAKAYIEYAWSETNKGRVELDEPREYHFVTQGSADEKFDALLRAFNPDLDKNHG